MRSGAALLDAGADEPIDRLNGVTLSPAELEGALDALASLPPSISSDPVERTRTLQAYARAYLHGDEVQVAALRARIAALGEWAAENDPQRRFNAEAVVEAACRLPLIGLRGSARFADVEFREMVCFIEELPW